VDLSFYKSYISEEIRDEGREEGREEGRAQGETRRAAKDVLTVLAARGIDVSDEARARITGSGDLDTLSRWLRRAATAPSADEIFSDEQDP
jgi:predicted transposase YdaD